jgi:hypothetical protein
MKVERRARMELLNDLGLVLGSVGDAPYWVHMNGLVVVTGVRIEVEQAGVVTKLRLGGLLGPVLPFTPASPVRTPGVVEIV